MEREIEDIDALIAEAGGSALLYGVSSGGALALEAAAAGLAIDKVAVYEVPYNMAADWPRRWSDYREQLEALLDDGRRGDALELFMRMAGSSDDGIAGAKGSPFWPALEAIAHTLAYDAACLGNGQPPVARFAASWMLALDQAAAAIVASIPRACRQIIAGQSHVAEPKVIAPVLEGFFAD